MVNSTECRKRFRAITARKENEGYYEWKEWVKEQIKNYDSKKMDNIIKRYEIRVKYASEDLDFEMSKVFIQYIPIISMFLTVFVTVMLAVLKDGLNAYGNAVEPELVNEYAKIVSDAILENGEKIMRYSAIVTIFFVVLIPAAYFCENYFKQKRIADKIYYSERLEILKEEKCKEK